MGLHHPVHVRRRGVPGPGALVEPHGTLLGSLFGGPQVLPGLGGTPMGQTSYSSACALS